MQSDREKSILSDGDENTKKPESISNETTIHSPVIRSTPLLSFPIKKRKFRFDPKKLLLPLLCLFLAFFLLSMYVEKKIAPILAELAEQSAKEYLYQTVNDTIGAMAQEGALDYDRMVTTIRDETGQVIYLEVNTQRLNEARSQILRRIRTDLKETKSLRVTLPFGTLTGMGVLGGRGLPIGVRVFSVGVTEGDVYTVLEDCGINQTRHMMCLNVKTSLYLVLPGENREASLELTLPLGERVLVGDVPEIYLDSIGAS